MHLHGDSNVNPIWFDSTIVYYRHIVVVTYLEEKSLLFVSLILMIYLHDDSSVAVSELPE